MTLCFLFEIQYKGLRSTRHSSLQLLCVCADLALSFEEEENGIL